MESGKSSPNSSLASIPTAFFLWFSIGVSAIAFKGDGVLPQRVQQPPWVNTDDHNKQGKR